MCHPKIIFFLADTLPISRSTSKISLQSQKKSAQAQRIPKNQVPCCAKNPPFFSPQNPRTLDPRRPSVPAVPEAGLRRQLRQTLRAAADLGVHLASSARDGWGTVFTEKNWQIIWEIVDLTMKNGGKCVLNPEKRWEIVDLTSEKWFIYSTSWQSYCWKWQTITDIVVS